MAKKMVMPVAWAQDVDCWLETLKAAGFSDDTVRSRRYKIARLCRELPSPMETTGEQITRVFAAHDWKPETRKGYRNTIAGFYRWFYETGRRGDNPTAKVPKVKKPQAHPHPCPDKYILMALGKATEDERRMIRLAADGFNGDTETGIWLVSGLDAASAAPVMSVDGFAKQFTHWPTQINGTELNGTEEKAKAAAACLA